MRTRHASPASLAGLTTWTLVMRVFHSLIGSNARPSAEPPLISAQGRQAVNVCDGVITRRRDVMSAEPFDLDGSSALGVVCLHGFTGTPYEVRFLGEQLARAGMTVRGVQLPG